jgi:PAS domain-containing protein
MGEAAAVTTVRARDAEGWPRLFATAFRRSRNAMLPTDERRMIVDANAALITLLGRKRGTLLGAVRGVERLAVGIPLPAHS